MKKSSAILLLDLDYSLAKVGDNSWLWMDFSVDVRLTFVFASSFPFPGTNVKLARLE
jgi:hypothetical protein